MNYHAHIYFNDPISKEKALGLRNRLAQIGAHLGSIHNTKIGPHPWPMYQINYDDAIKNDVESYLDLNGSGLSILLHTETGNIVQDHTEAARWLGPRLELDIEWLQAYQEHLRYR